METHHALWSCCRPAWTHRVRTEDRRDSGRQSTRRHDRHPHCFGRQLDAFDNVDGCPWDLVLICRPEERYSNGSAVKTHNWTSYLPGPSLGLGQGSANESEEQSLGHQVRRSTYAFRIGHKDSTINVSSKRITRLLRLTNDVYGVAKGYGCESKDLGTRSIRSGAAMALFLMDHSVEKIMILGRWSSDAFMVYIRPQDLECSRKRKRQDC
jgi:hypothetical protein